MPLATNIKSELVKKIEQYEGRFNHLYLVRQPSYINGSVALSAFVARRASPGMVVPFTRSTT